MSHALVRECVYTGKQGACEGPVNPETGACEGHTRRAAALPPSAAPRPRPEGPFRDDMTLAEFQDTIRRRGLYLTRFRRYETQGEGASPSEYVVEGTSYQHNRIVEYAEGNDLVDVLNRLAVRVL